MLRTFTKVVKATILSAAGLCAVGLHAAAEPNDTKAGLLQRCASINGTCDSGIAKALMYGDNNHAQMTFFTFGFPTLTAMDYMGSTNVDISTGKTNNEYSMYSYNIGHPAMMPMAGAGWTKCADEGGVCNVTVNKYNPDYTAVAYGANGKFEIAYVGPTPLNCNNDNFNGAKFDPAPGVKKSCYVTSAGWHAIPQKQADGSMSKNWMKCAGKDREVCNLGDDAKTYMVKYEITSNQGQHYPYYRIVDTVYGKRTFPCSFEAFHYNALYLQTANKYHYDPNSRGDTVTCSKIALIK